MAPGGMQRAQVLAALDEDTCDAYGFPAAAFTEETMQLVRELGGTMRRRAMRELRGLEDEAAAMHSAAIAQLLEDPAIDMRSYALKALTGSRITNGACGDAVVVREGAAIVRLLADPSPPLRDAAFGTLNSCEKAVAQHSAAIAQLLEHQVDSSGASSVMRSIHQVAPAGRPLPPGSSTGALPTTLERALGPPLGSALGPTQVGTVRLTVPKCALVRWSCWVSLPRWSRSMAWRL